LIVCSKNNQCAFFFDVIDQKKNYHWNAIDNLAIMEEIFDISSEENKFNN
jgi:hypothetical protein